MELTLYYTHMSNKTPKKEELEQQTNNDRTSNNTADTNISRNSNNNKLNPNNDADLTTIILIVKGWSLNLGVEPYAC